MMKVRLGPAEGKDDFDLASIPSSDLRLCAMHMLHAAVAFNRIATARTRHAPGSRS